MMDSAIFFAEKQAEPASLRTYQCLVNLCLDSSRVIRFILDIIQASPKEKAHEIVDIDSAIWDRIYSETGKDRSSPFIQLIDHSIDLLASPSPSTSDEGKNLFFRCSCLVRIGKVMNDLKKDSFPSDETDSFYADFKRHIHHYTLVSFEQVVQKRKDLILLNDHDLKKLCLQSADNGNIPHLHSILSSIAPPSFHLSISCLDNMALRATQYGHLDYLDYLLAKSPFSYRFTKDYIKQYILSAAKAGQLDCLSYLFTHLEAFDKSDDDLIGSALMYAAEPGGIECLEFLLRKIDFSDPTFDLYFKVACTTACQNNHIACVELLLKNSEITTRASFDDCLQICFADATRNNSEECIKCLLSHVSSKRLRQKQILSKAIKIAISKKYVAIHTILLEHL